MTRDWLRGNDQSQTLGCARCAANLECTRRQPSGTLRTSVLVQRTTLSCFRKVKHLWLERRWIECCSGLHRVLCLYRKALQSYSLPAFAPYRFLFAAIRASMKIPVLVGIGSWQKQADGASHQHSRYINASKKVSRRVFTNTGFLSIAQRQLHRSVCSVSQTISSVPSCKLQVRLSSTYGSRIGAAEGRGSSNGVEYSYTLSTHLWYGVYEVNVSIRAVRISTLISVAVARAPLYT